MESILETIRKLIGGEEYGEHFDADLIIQINMAFSILTQLGVGPEDGFFITDDSAVWTDFIGDSKRLEMVKTYVYLKVKLVFDPPTNSSLYDAYDKQIKELEWRINVTVDPKEV